MTLRDLIPVWWTPVKITIIARNEDRHFLHEWIFGPDVHESMHQWHDRKDGKLDIIDTRVNFHGEPKKKGDSEMGWGINPKIFPDAILDAPIQVMVPTTSSSYGDSVRLEVEMNPMQVEIIKGTLKVRPLDD